MAEKTTPMDPREEVAERTCPFRLPDRSFCEQPAAYRLTYWTTTTGITVSYACIEHGDAAERLLYGTYWARVERTPLLDTPEGQLAHVADNLRDAITDLVATTEPGEPCAPAERGLRHLSAFLASLDKLQSHLLTHGRAEAAIHGAEVFGDAGETVEEDAAVSGDVDASEAEAAALMDAEEEMQ
jgi:hypothetical protein